MNPTSAATAQGGHAPNTRETPSLDEAHRRYRRRLEGVAQRILGSRADAEDVVQRVFLKLPSARFEGRSSLWTYLYRSAVNASVNVLRSRRRRERLEARLVERDGLAAAACTRREIGPEARVLEGEILAGVARALLRVKRQHRRVLVMRVIWGLSNADIAALEDIPPATVGTWLRRGREELVREMKPMLDELEEGT